MFTEDGPRTETLEARHYLSNRVFGRKPTEAVDMIQIQAQFQLLNLNPVRFRYFEQQFTHALTHNSYQDLLLVFGRPHQVILRVINTMTASSKSHPSIVDATLFQRLRRCALSSPAASSAGYPERF
jgi:hypothetical protein